METKLKLEISQLKNYLGTRLKVYINNNEPCIDVLTGFLDDNYFTVNQQEDYYIEDIKPLMCRLQDLDKFIPELGFVPIIQLARFVDNGHSSEISKIKHYPNRIRVYTNKADDVEDVNFNITNNSTLGAVHLGYDKNVYLPTYQRIMDQLFEWNFWVFGDEYFEQGLIIDKLKNGN